jgi:HD-like signal output (HDOD) protein
MMSQEPLGHLVQLHGKPHLELLGDQLASASVNYSHNSDRNNIWNADVSFQTSMIIHQLVSEVGLQVIQREKYRNKR